MQLSHRPPAATLKAHPDLAKWFPVDDPKSYSDAAAKIGRIPVWIFHGADDDTVPPACSRDYAAFKKKSGERVELIEVAGAGHFDFIDPRSEGFRKVREAVAAALG